MSARAIMVQGTASHVGKSLVVAGLCRVLARHGVRVVPFKAQNMALNSFVTPDGLEIGRAQATQAQAAGVEPRVEMNPVLLKPAAEAVAQVVLLGRPSGHLRAADFKSRRALFWEAISEAYGSLARDADVVVIEGAGSPAEVNLREGDVVNMAVAALSGADVMLVGDIDRGGVFASLVGTVELLAPEDRSRLCGLVINKFRGHRKLLEPGLAFLERRTGIPVLGVLPYLNELRLAEEDSVSLESRPVSAGSGVDIAVVELPHISNFSDVDPLRLASDVTVRYVSRAADLGRPDLIVIPGTKNTIEDCRWLHTSGLAFALRRLAGQVPLIGICGGYQILGGEIADPRGIETSLGGVEGLGLLDVTTELLPGKSTKRVTGRTLPGHALAPEGQPVTGYEIHAGASTLGSGRPWFEVGCEGGGTWLDGAVDEAGLVAGTYMHGLFDDGPLRETLLNALRRRRGLHPRAEADWQSTVERSFDRLADTLEEHLDLRSLDLLLAGRQNAPDARLVPVASGLDDYAEVVGP